MIDNTEKHDTKATASPGRPDRGDIAEMLATATTSGTESLFSQALGVRVEKLGTKAYLRGIVEFSNVCAENCLYCGIRKDNRNAKRFTLPKEEILKEARGIHGKRYGSIVLQAGERRDKEFALFVEDILKEIKKIGDGALGITISLGEQTEDTYKRWFDAGAHRYLLRIETSNPALFAEIHPPTASFEKRRGCLDILRKLGYQVGTGVMIGFPGQSIGDIADDIEFFRSQDIDMIGMGPFIPHKDTPMGAESADFDPRFQLELALKTIAATRLALPDANIAAATSLRALRDDARIDALLAGANVLMPNVTDGAVRPSYDLYDGKPMDDTDLDAVERELRANGLEIGWDEWGDSPRFHKRKTAMEATRHA
jgi:biotin synthase